MSNLRNLGTTDLFEIRNMLGQASFVNAGLGLLEHRHMQLGNPGDVSWTPDAECVVFGQATPNCPGCSALEFFVSNFNGKLIVGYSVEGQNYCTSALPLFGDAARSAQNLLS